MPPGQQAAKNIYSTSSIDERGIVMALGEYQIFTWKSKATQQKEQEDYGKWAFPYGEKQREALQELLLGIYPKETIPTTLIPFLTCKELYEGLLNKTGSREAAVDTLINKQKKYKQIIKKKTMVTYLAVVLADADIDERCNYPSTDIIMQTVQELEKLRTTD